jgi:hypothetical protein
VGSPRAEGMWWARSVSGRRAWIAYLGVLAMAGGGSLAAGYAFVRFPYNPATPEQTAPRWIIDVGLTLLVIGALLFISGFLTSPRWEPELPVASMSRRGELVVGIVAVAGLLVVSIVSPNSELRWVPVAVTGVMTAMGEWRANSPRAFHLLHLALS